MVAIIAGAEEEVGKGKRAKKKREGKMEIRKTLVC